MRPRRRSTLRLVLAGVFAVLALTASAVILHRLSDAVRRTPIRSLAGGTEGLPSLSDPHFRGTAAALSESVFEPGHQVEVLTDLALFERMLEDLARARRSVTFLGYYCAPGLLGDRIVSVLAERARVGVTVLFMGDDFGCGSLLRTVRMKLEAAGAEVVAFRPVRWNSLHRGQHRMHARSVIVDGAIGYTGGFGIDDKWILDRPDEPRWRETGVRFTGPAVRRFQSAFLVAWAEATGELRSGAALLPEEASPLEGGAPAALLYSRPGLGTTAAERYLALTLVAAERTLWVANAYFVPMPTLRVLLLDAAARGVDVRLLLPGPRTDIRSTRWAGRAFYEEFLDAGIRIFEYQPAMMHAKAMVADGTWAAVGSLNLDNRSIRLNEESALLIHDAAVGGVLDSLFLADQARSVEIGLESHRARPRRERLLERLMRTLWVLL